jgi:multidrug efflux pump subunit AcrA (membrane-fusion protein)
MYDTTVRLESGVGADLISPGMSGSVTFTLCDKEKTITIPASALKTSELDPEEQYVLVEREGEAPEKRSVTVGQKSDKRVEILKGLEPGDVIRP